MVGNDLSPVLFSVSGLVSFIGFFLHVFGGGRMFVRPLLADMHLSPEVKWLSYVSWHVTSILLLGSAAAFAYTAKHPGDVALATLASSMHAAVAVLCLFVGVRLHPIMLRLPAIYLFGLIAFLGAAGVIARGEGAIKSGTYEVEAPGDALVSTDITTDGLNLNQPGVQAARDSVPNDTDVISSYTAGTCNMCHDSFLAATHMEQNGGVIGGWRAEALGD